MGKGIKDIALLAPNNDYGQRVAAALRRAVIPGNGNVGAVEFYMPDATDVDVEIQRLLKSNKTTFNKIDAIMIAEGGSKLEYIIERLNNFGANRGNVKFLGTGKWDDETLLFNPELNGGLFATTPMRAYQGFQERFMQQYGYRPPRIASLSYDAVSLAIALANMKGGAQFTEANITNPKGYYGSANGLFRCMKDGICERSLSLIQITPKGFEEIEPALRAFRD
jgi:ABC-type branched-subunit amino acid transport system substrate-binding protein